MPIPTLEAGVVAYVSVLLDQLGAGPADNAAPDAAPGAAADVEGEEMPLLVALSQGFSEVAELILQDKAGRRRRPVELSTSSPEVFSDFDPFVTSSGFLGSKPEICE